MWKLRETAGGHSKQKNLRRVKEALESLPDEIPDCIRYLQVGIDSLDAASNYDIVLIADFDTFEALDQYLNNPAHLKVADLVMEVREARTAVDFVVD